MHIQISDAQHLIIFIFPRKKSLTRVQAYSYDKPIGGGTKSNEKTVVYLVDPAKHTGYPNI